jgi:hypothetical protein
MVQLDCHAPSEKWPCSPVKNKKPPVLEYVHNDSFKAFPFSSTCDGTLDIPKTVTFPSGFVSTYLPRGWAIREASAAENWDACQLNVSSATG